MFKAYGIAAGVALLSVAGLGALIYWKRDAIGNAIGKTVNETLNPLSDKNAAYGAVNSTGALITGDDSFNLGAWIWEKSHPAQVRREKQITSGPSAPDYNYGGSVLDSLSPFNVGA